MATNGGIDPTRAAQTAAALQVLANLAPDRRQAAADVLADLLDRVPGPTLVSFDGGERASKLAAKLADGLAAPASTGPAGHDGGPWRAS